MGNYTTWHLRRAASILRRGSVIAYPTESVFGLGCDPRNGDAVLRLLALKNRNISQGLILIASRFSQLQPFVELLGPERMRNIQASWPGPTTWIFPTHPATPDYLTGHHASLAIRVSADPSVVALCEHFDGALVSTSANLSGRPPARTALDVRRYFGKRLDYILPGSVGGRRLPSEIRDGFTGRVLRAG
uniref:Threonylcarbamoyl-AMP synthase n=1 Tax=Candidatus Kentrum sp. TUN TaxID=2126343 RepID=A0A451A376_9GAMM|nr:MAG: L-threonylcarbamoyladenylate synthase [Candidatus Kentron sp. TUN]VFK53296.1 MAG: L-threonylcarbamoyladenylate synthase [Candidatus Kentron sp. TUN]VFK60483.1 MAG: L-threonylcarbamoyladenylate synthase [Candidatus Kentron sp. TUN]